MREDDSSWTVWFSSSSPDSCHFAAPLGWQIHTSSTKFVLSTSTTSAVCIDKRRRLRSSGGVERPNGGQQSDRRIAIDLVCREEPEELCQGPTKSLRVGQWCVVAKKPHNDVSSLEILLRIVRRLYYSPLWSCWRWGNDGLSLHRLSGRVWKCLTVYVWSVAATLAWRSTDADHWSTYSTELIPSGLLETSGIIPSTTTSHHRLSKSWLPP